MYLQQSEGKIKLIYYHPTFERCVGETYINLHSISTDSVNNNPITDASITITSLIQDHINRHTQNLIAIPPETQTNNPQNQSNIETIYPQDQLNQPNIETVYPQDQLNHPDIQTDNPQDQLNQPDIQTNNP